ncbi:MAG: MFS transporter, partial [Planctomycetes bacterium]|nr:MFS transporter [Planctomycetota bacterium]
MIGIEQQEHLGGHQGEERLPGVHRVVGGGDVGGHGLLPPASVQQRVAEAQAHPQVARHGDGDAAEPRERRPPRAAVEGRLGVVEESAGRPLVRVVTHGACLSSRAASSTAATPRRTTPPPPDGPDATLSVTVTPTPTNPLAAVTDAAVRGRRALPALTVVYLLVFASSGIQLPLTAVAMQKVGLSPSAIGAMWGARSLTAAVAPFFWGLLADRLGTARPLLALSLTLGAGLTALLSTTTTPWVCVVIFGVYGATTGPAGSMLDGMTLTALGTSRAQFGRWRAFGTVGFGVSSLVVTLLLQEGVLQPLPRSLFPLCAALLALGAFVVAVGVPTLPRPALSDPRLVGVAFRQPLLVGLVTLGMVLWCSHGAWAGFLAVVVERAGLPAVVTGAAVAFSVLTEAVIMSAAPRLSARFGVPAILVAAAALAFVRWAASALPLSATAFVLLHGLHGVTFGLFFVVVVGVVAERCPPELRQASQGL